MLQLKIKIASLDIWKFVMCILEDMKIGNMEIGNVKITIEDMEVWEFENVWYIVFYLVLWKCATTNDENWLNQISNIMDMNFISIKKHEMAVL